MSGRVSLQQYSQAMRKCAQGNDDSNRGGVEMGNGFRKLWVIGICHPRSIREGTPVYGADSREGLKGGAHNVMCHTVREVRWCSKKFSLDAVLCREGHDGLRV